ncbi:hypothetical protein [uncultured Sphaerochaeta sp.]|uniref:hypothetical protein n=1 Tax=uncultured Sphaerochaeta sp. TaxID=886478 RepID=UPI0029CA9B82|nr:hypothetical protein [uncultured Sphaerochaeta sp.]
MSDWKEVSVGVIMFRKAVNEENYSTESWCEMLGLSRSNYYKILKGQLLPSPAVQMKLNIILGLVNDWLPNELQYANEEMLEKRQL